jgi:hypothetical protein
LAVETRAGVICRDGRAGIPPLIEWATLGCGLSSLFHARVSMNRHEELLILTFGAVDHPLDDAFLQSAYRAEATWR